jgi:ribosomal protein S18 acetylase RimI-like enzyme
MEIKNANIKDFKELARLLVRLKRLNSEFDPLYATGNDTEDEAEEYLKKSFDDENTYILKAVINDKIVGMLKAVIERRSCYIPKLKCVIKELYVLPEHRRTGAGIKMIDEIVKMMKTKDVGMVVAEFPTHNEIARKFYEGLGYRAISSQYGKLI